MEHDAHAREAIGVGDQPDDLEQHIPLETCRKILSELLETAGLIADGLPGEVQDLSSKGSSFSEARYVKRCSISASVHPSPRRAWAASASQASQPRPRATTAKMSALTRREVMLDFHAPLRTVASAAPAGEPLSASTIPPPGPE